MADKKLTEKTQTTAKPVSTDKVHIVIAGGSRFIEITDFFKDLFDTAVNDSDNITEGAANLFLLAAERSKLTKLHFKGADIPSATSTPIGAATGFYIDVTGATTITSFDTADAGIMRVVHFTGALLLTHNGTALILPTGANITTAAGDVGVFISLGSGNWRCVGYLPQSGAPLGFALNSIQEGHIDWGTGPNQISTFNIPELTNLFFTDARVRAAVLTGIAFGDSADVVAADTVLVALGKLQAQTTLKLENLIEDTTPQLGGELDLNGKSVGGTPQSATGDGTTTIDWKDGNVFDFQFGAFNEVFTFTAPTKPGTFLLKLVQDSVGSRTATFPAAVKWIGGTAPTLTTTATTGTDIITFYYDGTNYFGVEAINFS